ncbi:DctP family TRAP transporter solute-binding subunit [Sporosarcina limicola]|uniref:C4-dicarboxylate-binding protein DctP n=1 Tax=Sporosarcina limicola TaxID=34101 RepID=A0A927RFL1_9BACL|nr:DctP family TRAP transporter solute-binding subunit [Sporosarcina limicola]MBE1555617.1 C4-dicarboxylate-binding protein DctP [Sporosarcina limicola]
MELTNSYKRIVFVFIGGIMLFVLCGCQSTNYPVDFEQLSEEERIVIRFSHVVGEETPKGLAARKFAQLVKERSGGYVEVQVFPNGFLYKDGEEMEALSNGDVQMIAPATSKVTSLIPEWSVIDLPFAFNSIEEVHDYLAGPVGQELVSKFDSQGLLMLGMWDNGFKQLSNRDYLIRYPEDLQQLKMRIMPSDIIDKQFSIAGAVPMKIDFNVVFQHLENGDIDGQENTLSNITSKNLHLLQNYLTVSNHGYLGYTLLMNKQFWDELPEDVQVLITDTLVEVNEWEWETARKLNDEKLMELEDCHCIDIYHLTSEERQVWEEAFQPVYNYYIKRFGAKYVKSLPKFQENSTYE